MAFNIEMTKWTPGCWGMLTASIERETSSLRASCFVTSDTESLERTRIPIEY